MYDTWDGEVKDLKLLRGDCIQLMKQMDNCVYDSICTDPPYMINLAGKKWDAPFDVTSWAEQCYRVLKHGGHMVCFGATRTIHRFTTALEDAGFEIRDMLTWVYWEGMPHSHDVGLAIDKVLGVESTPIGVKKNSVSKSVIQSEAPQTGYNNPDKKTWVKKTPASDKGIQYKGYGTGLKPCQEPIILVRKPLSENSVARNVLKHGTGALNLDSTRHFYGDPLWLGPNDEDNHKSAWGGRFSHAEKQFSDTEYREYEKGNHDISSYTPDGGRWPANVLYCPKPRRKERDLGLEHLTPPVVAGTDREYSLLTPRANIHLTVKPLLLMRWLVKLITPRGGQILDPFIGSGTTGMAGILEGFDVTGCELTEKYYPIIEGRCRWARDEYKRENAQQKIPW